MQRLRAIQVQLENKIRSGKDHLGIRRLSIGNAEVSAGNLDTFMPTAWYTGQTFLLLRATVQLPPDTRIILDDERVSKFDGKVKRLLVICFQEKRHHWVLRDFSLVSDNGNVPHHRSISLCLRFLSHTSESSTIDLGAIPLHDKDLESPCRPSAYGISDVQAEDASISYA